MQMIKSSRLVYYTFADSALMLTIILILGFFTFCRINRYVCDRTLHFHNKLTGIPTPFLLFPLSYHHTYPRLLYPLVKFTGMYVAHESTSSGSRELRSLKLVLPSALAQLLYWTMFLGSGVRQFHFFKQAFVLLEY